MEGGIYEYLEDCIYVLMSSMQTVFCELKSTHIIAAENLLEIGCAQTACLFGCPQFISFWLDVEFPRHNQVHLFSVLKPDESHSRVSESRCVPSSNR
jgi:hypothetical protein